MWLPLVFYWLSKGSKLGCLIYMHVQLGSAFSWAAFSLVLICLTPFKNRPGTSQQIFLNLLMLTLGTGPNLTFIKVLTINTYQIIFFSNIQIFTVINISNYEESLWENTIHKIANPIKTLFNIKFTNHGWEREECNWMCSSYHPNYGCISFVITYRVKFTK
jgi:hypothetical protein